MSIIKIIIITSYEYIYTKPLIRVYVDVQSNDAQNEFPQSEKCLRIRIHISEKEILLFFLNMAGKIHCLRKTRSNLQLKILRKKIFKGVAGLNCRSATLPKAELFYRYFSGSFNCKCRAKLLEVIEQLFCRTPIYLGHLSVNVTTLWKVSIKISNKKK